ncbi:MAG: hypothetical protein ACI4QN_00165 [Candidatus Coproplasma sp.]
MKKIILFFISILMCLSFVCGCAKSPVEPPESEDGEIEVTPDPKPEPEPEPEPDWLDLATDEIKTNLSADGYVKDKLPDFSVYEGTDAYRKVSNADEFTAAISDAIWHYQSIWNGEGEPITQGPDEGYTEENFRGTVHVIEITQGIDLGYNKLSDTAKNSGVISNNIKTKTINDNGTTVPAYTMSSMVEEYGMSELKIQHINDLLIYSKNGAKITHATMNVMSSHNVAFRNLQFDEVWQWEDSETNLASKVGDYDSQKWAYFKISFCGYIWIDHCSFGKAFDGLIDYSNPVYNATEAMVKMPMNRNPYGLTEERGVHISWCSFNSGSDDENGYIYKMMTEIEQNYQANLQDSSVKCKYLYYKALRDAGSSFEDILYGLAIPQKKAFLCGDSGDNLNDYEYNRKLDISISNCYFKNVEDRIPKLRGGNGYFYNCIVDNYQYYTYRTKLSSYASAVTKLGGNSSGWKCALVSQCLLSSNGASLMAENCIFRGVATLIKNNDSASDTDTERNKGYYQIKNCTYQLTAESNPVVGSTTDTVVPMQFKTTTAAYTDGFVWHTADGEVPFTICATSLDNLESTLNDENYGVGVRAAMGEKCLKSNYLK